MGKIAGAVPRAGGDEAVEAGFVGTQRGNGERRIRRAGQGRTILEPLPAQRAVAQGIRREQDGRAGAIGVVARRIEDGIGLQGQRRTVGHRVGRAVDFNGVETFVRRLGVGHGEQAIGFTRHEDSVLSPADDQRSGAADRGGEGGRSAGAGELVRQPGDPERHLTGRDHEGVEQLGRDERAAVHPHRALHCQVRHGHGERAAVEDAAQHRRSIIILRAANLEDLAIGQQRRGTDAHRVEQVPVVDGQVRALAVVTVGAKKRPGTGRRRVRLEARRIRAGVRLPRAEGLRAVAIDEGRAVTAVVPVVIPVQVGDLAEGPRVHQILRQSEDRVVREGDLPVILRGEHRVAAHHEVVRDHEILVVRLRAVAQQQIRAKGRQRMKRRVARQADARRGREPADEDIREHRRLRSPRAALEDDVALQIVAANLPALRVDVHPEPERVGDDVVADALGPGFILGIDRMPRPFVRLLPADVVDEAAVNLRIDRLLPKAHAQSVVVRDEVDELYMIRIGVDRGRPCYPGRAVGLGVRQLEVAVDGVRPVDDERGLVRLHPVDGHALAGHPAKGDGRIGISRRVAVELPAIHPAPQPHRVARPGRRQWRNRRGQRPRIGRRTIPRRQPSGCHKIISRERARKDRQPQPQHHHFTHNHTQKGSPCLYPDGRSVPDGASLPLL